MKSTNIPAAVIIGLALLLSAVIACPTSEEAPEAPWIWRESSTELRVIYEGHEVYRITADGRIEYLKSY